MNLREKTIVVTRPKSQAIEFIDALERFGAKVIAFPTIEIVAPESYDDLDAAIDDLQSYDWLIFTSANAVEYFLQRFDVKGLEVFELDLVRTCAVGEATAERLRLAQIHLDVVALKSSAEGVFDALSDFLVGEFENVRFLFPRSAIARDFLPARLRQNGAFVSDVAAYQTVLPSAPETGKLKALLGGGAIDCITFASSSAVKNFAQMFQNHRLAELLKNVAVACIGETTAQTASDLELQVEIIPDETTAESFAKAISEHFRTK
ncbi:MAG: uroporphyrinogen-III synthase [Pyrinomonadaceae bacterium]|nr:uroporphyrinogen-III synthase [Pyrinomonadaceae bacterium]